MENKVIQKANLLIERLCDDFERTGKFNEAKNERICGMLEALEIMTGKNYYYDENGVHEK